MCASESTYYFEGFVISRFYICPGALIKNELVHQDFVQIHSSANDLLSIVNRGCVVLKRVQILQVDKRNCLLESICLYPAAHTFALCELHFLRTSQLFHYVSSTFHSPLLISLPIQIYISSIRAEFAVYFLTQHFGGSAQSSASLVQITSKYYYLFQLFCLSFFVICFSLSPVCLLFYVSKPNFNNVNLQRFMGFEIYGCIAVTL